MFVIEQTISAEDKKYISGCRTVRQQLETLKRIKVRPENELSLIEELNRTHWKAGESAMQFVWRMNELKGRMKTARDRSEDATFCSKLIREAPKSLGFTRRSIQEEIAEGRRFEWNALCERVSRAFQTAEQEAVERGARGDQSSAGSSGKLGGRAVYYTSKRTCHTCGSIYHLARDCPDKDRANRPGSFRSRYQSAVERVNSGSNVQGRQQQQSEARGDQQQSREPNRNQSGNQQNSNRRHESN